MRVYILSLLLGLTVVSQAAAVEKTTPRMIRDAAHEFLKQFVREQQAEGREVSYSLGNLDSRLNLAACPDGPTVDFSSNPMQTTQPTLEVSCQGQRPWRMYLSVSMEIRGQALVAARALSRGARVTESMIRSQAVVINASRRGAITDSQSLVGMEIRRSVSSGTLFTPDIVTQPDAVARGDHVIIIARSGPIAVQSRGKALGNGRVGEQVLVQNLRSEKTLRALVTSPGHVEVPM
ncbi:flagellar basal body P-ring formation chaperone FlgA [Marinobacter sp. JSM 1782161]|uniref:flagellar basal body P-ring formation chaperone FlgA n=1 Tax=Marinobacter sp. JSM 1782161 TaxID=2685906 RepID=UPI00140282DE|nr:flagellar basal body P-ring formation chaperone FlgA [Marinobacter sp. JSM 1782161]